MNRRSLLKTRLLLILSGLSKSLVHFLKNMPGHLRNMGKSIWKNCKQFRANWKSFWKKHPVLKMRLIFFSWIAGLILASSILWSLSFPYRSDSLLRSVNRVLASAGDARHIASPLPRPLARQAPRAPMGFWYTITESNRIFFVFVIMREGILVPCGAEITEDGKVAAIVPLGSHARQVIERIPQGVINVYINRIESAVLAGRGR